MSIPIHANIKTVIPNIRMDARYSVQDAARHMDAHLLMIADILCQKSLDELVKHIFPGRVPLSFAKISIVVTLRTPELTAGTAFLRIVLH